MSVYPFLDNDDLEWEYEEVDIGDVQNILLDYDVEVLSPDGYVPVIKYVEKGKKQIYNVLSKDNILLVECSAKHLFFTKRGWIFTEDLIPTDQILNSHDEFISTIVIKTNTFEYVVDIAVDHPNHRYYTNGLVSHNTNIGKSLILCGLAVNALMNNKKVLYITLEMSDKKIAERILANMFDIGVRELKLLTKDQFKKKYAKIRTSFEQLFMVKEYAPGSINSNHLRNLLKEYKMKKTFIPDIIFLDYIGLMLPIHPKKDENSNSELKRISEEVRGVSVDLISPIVSALQTNRGGFSAVDLDLTDTADSIGTTATADIIVGIIQTDELKSAGLYSWIILKNRYGPNKVRTKVAVDYSKMRIYPCNSEVEKFKLIDSGYSESQPIVNNITTEALKIINGKRQEQRNKIFDFK